MSRIHCQTQAEVANQTRVQSLFLQPFFLSSRTNLHRYNMVAILQETCGPQSRVLFPQFNQRVRICDNSQHERHQPRWFLMISKGKPSVWSSFGERRDFSVCCPFQPDFAPCPLRCMLSFMCLVDYSIQEVRKVGSRACLFWPFPVCGRS